MSDLTDDEIRALLYVKETMVLAEECLRLRAELKEAVALLRDEWIAHAVQLSSSDIGFRYAAFLAKHKEPQA